MLVRVLVEKIDESVVDRLIDKSFRLPEGMSISAADRFFDPRGVTVVFLDLIVDHSRFDRARSKIEKIFPQSKVKCWLSPN